MKKNSSKMLVSDIQKKIVEIEKKVTNRNYRASRRINTYRKRLPENNWDFLYIWNKKGRIGI